MATTNNSFVVKNGLIVNNNLIWANTGKIGFNTSSPDANVAIIGTANISGNTTIGGITTLNANLTIGSGVTIVANGSSGSAGQVLTSTGSNVYWSTSVSGLTGAQIAANNWTFTNAITISNTTIMNANLTIGSGVTIIANGSPGSAGQVLTSADSTGSNVYWSTSVSGLTGAQIAANNWTFTNAITISNIFSVSGNSVISANLSVNAAAAIVIVGNTSTTTYSTINSTAINTNSIILSTNAVVGNSTQNVVFTNSATTFSNSTISGFLGNINKQTANYTLANTDSGKIVEMNSSSATTVTLPNTAPVGFNCTVVQTGTGNVTFSNATGTTFFHRSAGANTSGQYALAILYVSNNSGGSAAAWIMGGDTA